MSTYLTEALGKIIDIDDYRNAESICERLQGDPVIHHALMQIETGKAALNHRVYELYEAIVEQSREKDEDEL